MTQPINRQMIDITFPPVDRAWVISKTYARLLQERSAKVAREARKKKNRQAIPPVSAAELLSAADVFYWYTRDCAFADLYEDLCRRVDLTDPTNLGSRPHLLQDEAEIMRKLHEVDPYHHRLLDTSDLWCEEDEVVQSLCNALTCIAWSKSVSDGINEESVGTLDDMQAFIDSQKGIDGNPLPPALPTGQQSLFTV